MSDKEKEIIQKMAKIIPNLQSDKQNYVLGVAEGLALAKELEKKDADSEQPAD